MKDRSMCLYPRLINNPKYKPNKKNGWCPPPVNNKLKKVPIGCKDCIECRKQKARGWQVRLMEDLKENKNAKFICFTFSNEKYKEVHDIVIQKTKDKITELQNVKYYTPEIRKQVEKLKESITGYSLENQIATQATRYFLERYRKEHGKSLRHWLVTELGHEGTENIHIHGIIWTNVSLENVEKHWQYGHVWKGKVEKCKRTKAIRITNFVNERTVNYIVKYVSKQDADHLFYNPIILTSPGIGANYTKAHDWKNNKFNEDQTNETYRTRSGYKIALPIYWRNKIYSEEQREKLWIQKIDKMERWVCGERVDISKNEKDYYKLLEYYRRVNHQLGYGNDNKTWEREQYERDRREMMRKERILQASRISIEIAA